MKVLLDTCVLSELQKPNGNPLVREAFNKFPDDSVFLSVFTIGEIAKGIALLAEGKKKRNLAEWLVGLQLEFADRILGIDKETAQLWGEMSARLQRDGFVLPAIDGLLAATALRNAMCIMTRNSVHFRETGVLLLDPWS